MNGGPSHVDTFDHKPKMYGMDGKTVAGLEQEQVIDLLRGPIDSHVTLTVSYAPSTGSYAGNTQAVEVVVSGSGTFSRGGALAKLAVPFKIAGGILGAAAKMLADKPDRTADDGRKLAALVRAEKAAERAQKARADAARIINAEKAAERKARDHELYQSAGLLIQAGLVDTTTGKPTRDRGELLGALMSLAEAQRRLPALRAAAQRMSGLL